MIPKYINDWLRVIENMKNDNTYKLAWGRALVECVYFSKFETYKNKAFIKLDDLAKCIVKYYWNQVFFFNLRQSPYASKNPAIIQIVNRLIKKFVQINGNSFPVWFDKAAEKLGDHLDKGIKSVVSILPENVSWRFKRVDDEMLDLYEYDYENRSNVVIFKLSSIKMLKDYSFVISKLLSYKWAQLLEKYPLFNI